jgi:TatD DNase family protein
MIRELYAATCGYYNRFVLIDSHCHLTYPGLIEDLPAVLDRARAAGVERFVTIGTHGADHTAALAVARAHAPVSVALGIHPHHAAEAPPDYLAALHAALTGGLKVVALGECGLDYHYDFSPRPRQREVFCAQLDLARRLSLPLVLHIREAHADALAIMREFLVPAPLPFVVHCFTGTPAECEAWLALGAHIGITGIVTYKNAADVRAAAQLVPPERLLVETDAPYLSPEPVRKIKINQPAHVAHTARFLAALRNIPFDTLAQQTTQNTTRIFRL